MQPPADFEGGEMPQFDGQRPQKPDGERPQMNGATPPDFENGENPPEKPQGERPQNSDQTTQKPDFFMPQSEHSTEFKIAKGGNMFSGIILAK